MARPPAACPFSQPLCAGDAPAAPAPPPPPANPAPYIPTQHFFEMAASAQLPGWRSAHNTTARVYGPCEFFTPCAWDDWECFVSIAAEAQVCWMEAYLHTCSTPPHGGPCASQSMNHTTGSPVTTPAWRCCHESTDFYPAAQSPSAHTTWYLSPCMSPQVQLARSKGRYRRQQRVVGVHHFSGSWLGLDGSKSLSLIKEVGAGARMCAFAGLV